jgi:hypothetical protein
MPEKEPNVASPPATSTQPLTVAAVTATCAGPWSPFVHTSGTYDLSHLQDRIITYEQPAQDGKPERIYNVEVVFSSHCFTRSPREGETVDQLLVYPGEKRIFDFDRYELSRMLPEILRQLPSRACYQTGGGNFFSIELREKGSYEIYFTVEKVGRGRIKLFVQSAYLRDAGHGSRSKGYKIGFFVILYNRLTNRAIKITPTK